MTSRDFCYWLQGHLEIGSPCVLTGKQLQVVKDHLNLVFQHEIDPSMGSAEHQKKLNQTHGFKANGPLVRC